MLVGLGGRPGSGYGVLLRLAERTDYGLRVLLVLAAARERMAVGLLAARLGVSENHLAKVVQDLQRSGWVATTRGHGGGVELAADLATLSVGEVVRRLEPDGGVVECLREGGCCVLYPACRLVPVLEGATEAFFAALDRVTLASLVRGAEPGLLKAVGIRRADP
jgi:Rrf2 family nitric oxide-sensitive transcriptional repressor